MGTPESPTETCQIFDLSTVEGVVARVKFSAAATARQEEAGEQEAADKRWFGLGRLISALEKTDVQVLREAGLTLLEEENGYLANAGLAVLNSPTVTAHNAENSDRTNSITDIFLSFIPKMSQLISRGERSPENYNFLQAVEGLLRLQEALQDKEKFSESIALSQQLNRRITRLHEWWLTGSSQASDMEGTLIREYFGGRLYE